MDGTNAEPTVPLNTFRDFYKADSFDIDNVHVSLNDVVFNGHDLTNYRAKAGYFYDCFAVGYYIRSLKTNMSHASYVHKCKARQVKFVPYEDKINLKAYLKGEIQDCENIDHFIVAPKKQLEHSFYFISSSDDRIRPFKCKFHNEDIEHKEDTDMVAILKGKTSLLLGSKKAKEVGRLRTPILIIPNIDSAVINFKNSLNTLKHQNIPTDKKADSLNQPNILELVMPSVINKNKNTSFIIKETLKGISKEDLQKVVCIFTDGQQWQLDQWEVDLGSVFAKALGVFVKYSSSQEIDEKERQNIEKYNIKVFKIESNNTRDFTKTMQLVWKAIYQNIEKNFKDKVRR
eukprot:GAHX01000532.1.p1 GENE.GAHX01000532.1~~GAHX01000532.1.p1  ORF type:complete len:358 (+),score=82.94 GAHX01000532.1:41-1075(+)